MIRVMGLIEPGWTSGIEGTSDFTAPLLCSLLLFHDRIHSFGALRAITRHFDGYLVSYFCHRLAK